MPEEWPDHQRGTLALKCAGPDDAQVRRASAEPPAPTLPGPVQHLAEVERNRFQRVVAGLDVPPLFEDRGAFAPDPARGLDEALGVRRREAARGREPCAGLTPEDTGRITEEPVAGAEAGPRRVPIHLVEEYARPDGHADLLRERVDGATGS